jgi:hypothetical protein
LSIIKRFYEDNRISIDNLSKQNFTIDFITGERTEINYTKAKIIDMYGFTIGLEKSKEKDMKIFAVYAEMEEKPRFYVEAKDSDELLKIMRKRSENGEPNEMSPGWDPVEISKVKKK